MPEVGDGSQVTQNKRKTDKKKAISANVTSPWPKRLALSAGVGVVLLLSATVFLNSPPERGVPEGTRDVAAVDRAHIEGDIHEDGETPAGGAHSSIWQDCGFYLVEVRSENAVHSLEHGAIWITYRADLPSEDVDQLRRFIRPPDKVLVSPIEGQDTAVVATAWGHQLDLDDPTDPRLDQFVNEFEGRGDAPEPGGLCTGGAR